jgi:hypothetical protein
MTFGIIGVSEVTHMSMSKIRRLVEKEIATAVVVALLNEGFTLAVDNGDNNGKEYEIVSRIATRVVTALFETDEAHLYAVKDHKPIGWVYFVYGNDGWDVISDYTTNLTKFIESGAVATIVDKYSD